MEILQILLQLEKHEIQIYNFPVSEMDPEHHWMRERMPFAVVGSNITITDQSTGQMYRGREYPWGCVNIEDKVSSDESSIHFLWPSALFFSNRDWREFGQQTPSLVSSQAALVTF